MTEQEAEQLLSATPGYGWLINDTRMFWSPADLEPFLGISANTIRRWADSGLIPGAVDFGTAGWRIPRSGLIIFLASRLGGSKSSNAG